MRIRSLLLAGIITVVVLCSGCREAVKNGETDNLGRKPMFTPAAAKSAVIPLTPEQVESVKKYEKYEALPVSTRQALEAKNLVGVKVWCATDHEFATDMLKVMIENGAQLSTEKDADLIIRKTIYPAGADKAIEIWEVDHKIPFTYRLGLPGFYDPEAWAQDIADTLGTESKVQKLANRP